MTVGVTELEEITETVGGDLKGVEEDGSNGAGLWYYVQGSGTNSAAVRQKNFGGDGGDVEYHGGVSPPSGHTDCGDDGKTCGGRDVGISTSGGGDKSSGLVPHEGVHSETAGGHSGTGGMPPNI